MRTSISIPKYGSDAWLKSLKRALAAPRFKVKPPEDPIERPTSYYCPVLKQKWERSLTDREWGNVQEARMLIELRNQTECTQKYSITYRRK